MKEYLGELQFQIERMKGTVIKMELAGLTDAADRLNTRMIILEQEINTIKEAE